MSDLTRAEAIAELTEHLNHWKRLLKEGICGKEQGERTIKSLEFAIDSLKTDSTIKEAYDKGYKDGQDALACHLELCNDEGSIIEIPEGVTNGELIKALFPYATIWKSLNDICLYTKGQGEAQVFDKDWWNSPYRKEQE